jgi:ACS family hexuronate transporter-like MFS transporter
VTPEADGRTRYRWTIVALLFVATTINYVDRQVLGILAPTLSRALHWSETDYGDIVSWFSLAYALGFLVAGRLIDRVGVKRGLGAAVVVWSLASMAHAFVRTAAGFSVARAALGLGESAIFPGAIKSVAEWFPKRERALAAGLFNAGTNTGAIVAPLLVPALVLWRGWQSAFVVTGALGLLWLALWSPLYRRPPRTPDGTDESVLTDDAARWSWTSLLGMRQTWAFAVGKLLADPVWWFYLYWLPKFLDAKYGIKLTGIAVGLVAVYVTADVGSIGGGWLSSALITRGWTVNRARKTAMLAMALLILPTTLAGLAQSAWQAIALVAVAAAAHQAWSANVYTLASDMFPQSAVGSVVGIGAFTGAMGGVIFQRLVGRLLDANGGSYTPIFVYCGTAYLVAWIIIHSLAPRLEPAARLPNDLVEQAA